MSETHKLNQPWLVAAWPGMGHVAMSGGFYLMSKLGMHALAEFWPRGLFEVEHVEVQSGLIRPGRLPRSRFFVWTDPKEKHDILVFIGEAQPPTGKHAFCQKLIDFAKQAGVQRVFTFAAMATQMHPKDESRVFAAATDADGMAELKELGVHIMEDGQISGLNGVLLGVAAENGLRGYSLLGEMPHLFAQLPFPKASLAVLKTFTNFAGIEIDFTELEEQARSMEEQLGQIVSQIEKAIADQSDVDSADDDDEDDDDDEPEFPAQPEEEEPKLTTEDETKVERLFEQARANRSKAYELKGLLDRLNVFKDFEDRFLDLFKKQH